MGRWDRNKRFDDPQGRGAAPHARKSEPLHRPEGSGVRNEGEKICLIVNPHAGAGRAGRGLDDLRAACDRAFANWEIRQTEGPRHAEELARAAAGEGFDLVAAVGGDGTCNEVVNGLMNGDHPVSRSTAFCVVPFGTGSDLIKSLQTPKSTSGALFLAGTGVTLPTDVGVVELETDGGRERRYFINVAGFGAQGDVVERANRYDKKWGGKLTFLRATVESALSYEPCDVRLAWDGPDGAASLECNLLSAFVANGHYCGGGMWVGRDGSMHDGLLDVTAIPPSPFLRQVREVRRLYDGHLERMRGARRFAAGSLEVEAVRAAAPVQVDVDGEVAGHLPANFRILPRCLQVRAGWLRPRL